MPHNKGTWLALMLVLGTVQHARAAGEGGTHTQSAFMCGNVFDQRVPGAPGNWLKGTCDYSVDGGLTFPLPSNKSIEIWARGLGPTLSVVVENCQPRPANAAGKPGLFQYCTAKTDVCGTGSDKRRVALLPLEISNRGKRFTIAKHTFLAVCAVVDSSSPEWENNGAIGKCIEEQGAKGGFGFWPYEDDLSGFQSCVNMARADYASIGETETHQGVLVEAWARDGFPGDVKCSLPKACFEATWGTDGAICVARKRGDEILNAFNKRTDEMRSASAAIDRQIQHAGGRTESERSGLRESKKFLEESIGERNTWAKALKAELDRQSKDPYACPKGRSGRGVLFNRSLHNYGAGNCAVPPEYDYPCNANDPPFPWDVP